MKDIYSLQVDSQDRVAFKLTIPIRMLDMIGVVGNDVKFESRKGSIRIYKYSNNIFSSLSEREKALQIKKYVKLNPNTFERKSEYIKTIEEYFNIGAYKVYMYLRLDIPDEEVDKVELIEKVNPLIKNARIVRLKSNGKESKRSVVQIPIDIAIMFLLQKTKKELKVSNAKEIFPESMSIPVKLIVKNDYIRISKLE
ncbi:hypothetical protein [Clostridium tertium]|jgi:hypothetical protein|uniref:hypothetical protein n=1 Tax=Clostridium tertium TaxID=1559 RepID=UPI0024B3A693|nr:hypothetical protein [Clostridium tertium]MBS6502456.1 hypothetical protein [Clostridium sp.]MDI9218159.1 hypothetical protein [Clostridium tertium]